VPQWIEIMLRTLAAIIALFLLTKLLSKKQLGKLSYFEYITGIAIGGIAAAVSTGIWPNWYLGFISMSIWVGVVVGLDYLSLKSKLAGDFIKGKGLVLIKDGKVLEDNLTKTRYTADNLLGGLRSKNAFEFADVEFAVLEPDGELNVLLRRENQPLTSKNLGIKIANEQEPQTVIIDGKIMDEPLATLGLNRGWLSAELEKIGAAIENVFIGQVDASGQLKIDCFDDKLQLPVPQKKAQLLATIKKCEADLEMFGLSSKDKSIIKMYENCAEELQKVISALKPILTR